MASASVGVSNVSGVSVASAAVRASARADRPGVHADLTGQAYDSEVSAYFRDDIHRRRQPSTTGHRRSVRLRRSLAYTRVLTVDNHGRTTARSVDSFAPPADSP